MPDLPPMCARRQALVSLAAPHRKLPKGNITMRVAGCKPTVCAKRVENYVKAIQKRVPFTSKCSQKRWRLGLRPRPPIARESGRTPSALASLTRKIENGVNAIQKRAPCIYSQLLQSPKSVGDWGSALPHSDGERLCACQSGTPKGGAPIPIFAPGARNPRYATVLCSSECSPNQFIATSTFDKNVKFEIGRNEFISPGSSSSILAGRLWISDCLEKCLLPDSSAHVTNLFLFPLPPPPRLPHYPPHLTSFEVQNINYIWLYSGCI